MMVVDQRGNGMDRNLAEFEKEERRKNLVHPCPKGLGKHRELVNRSGGKEPYVIPFLCIILTEKLFS